VYLFVAHFAYLLVLCVICTRTSHCTTCFYTFRSCSMFIVYYFCHVVNSQRTIMQFILYEILMKVVS